MVEGLPGNIEQPPYTSGLVLPHGGLWVFDDVFEWVVGGAQDVINNIADWITNAVTWVYENIVSWFQTQVQWLYNQIIAGLEALMSTVSWVGGHIEDMASWVYNQVFTALGNSTRFINDKLSLVFDGLYASVTWLWDQVSEGLTAVSDAVGSSIEWFFQETGSLLTSIPGAIESSVQSGLGVLWAGFTELFNDFGGWVFGFLDTVGAWLEVDIPGHSPRWTAIFEGVGNFVATWLYEFPKWFFKDIPERAAYGLGESFKFVGDTLNEIFDAYFGSMLQASGAFSPVRISDALGRFDLISRIGLTTFGTLSAMTVAGELLQPLKQLGLGRLSAMLWDVTHYKKVTGAFVESFTEAALHIPLEHYFMDHFRPNILRDRDFMQLMSRGAFRHPELLRNPELTSSLERLEHEYDGDVVDALIGHYGYPAAYRGLFQELSYQRLGYFALAGIARVGFWDEAWFIEALARTGYSVTARDALLRMYREQVNYARTAPVMTYVRRGIRDGYWSQEEANEHISTVAEIGDLGEIRTYAMVLERELENKDTAVDITLQAFSRGMITETEARDNLRQLIKDGEIAELRILQTKVGLVRKVSLTAPAPEAAPIIVGEEF